ncbi:MAG: hypothetical protein IJ598_01940 [Ruminococcus sp.]|nr:hypothetical protein [Ruminococcus sp.]
MLSSLQRLSKDMIIYSVLLADFEKLDFKNDALAGVRANFFNSNRCTQSDKTELVMNGESLSLRYTMKDGDALSWKMTQSQRPYQTVVRDSDHAYCVMTYSDKGIVCKRGYYDNRHQWLRTDYFHPVKEEKLLARVSPCKIDGLMALQIEKIADDGARTRAVLFPSEAPNGVKCAALVYSNAGMLWYDVRFAPTSFPESEEEHGAAAGFSFSSQDFLSSVSEPLDLIHAPALSAEDVAAVAEPITEDIPEDEKPYSAYERIRNILFEAQKTNKNIFGEVAEYAEDEKAVSSASEELPEEETAGEEPQPVSAEAVEDMSYEAKPEEEATIQIKTPGGVYAYFGQLDESNQRVGRGRMTAPDGTPVYEGAYNMDKRDGFGICYYKDGSPNYVGDWSMGSRSGRGVGFRQSDGTLHAGQWTDNKPSGIGARFDNEGNFLDVCAYENGVRQGKSLSFDEQGRVLIRVWEDGELVSERVISDEE